MIFGDICFKCNFDFVRIFVIKYVQHKYYLKKNPLGNRLLRALWLITLQLYEYVCELFFISGSPDGSKQFSGICKSLKKIVPILEPVPIKLNR